MQTHSGLFRFFCSAEQSLFQRDVAAFKAGVLHRFADGVGGHFFFHGYYGAVLFVVGLGFFHIGQRAQRLFHRGGAVGAMHTRDVYDLFHFCSPPAFCFALRAGAAVVRFVSYRIFPRLSSGADQTFS